MSDPARFLREVVDSLAVRPPLSFRWFGTAAWSIPRRRRQGLTETQLNADLVERLASTLYATSYRRGIAAAAPTGNAALRSDPVFVDALSRANCGTGCREPGWRLVGRNGSDAVVTRGGLAFTVRRTTASGSTLILPKELLRVAPGFYTALGDRSLDAGARIVRIYWNVEAKGAAPLVAALTRLLNEKYIPFRLKVANNPGAFDRCDAGVLYVRWRDRKELWPLLEAARHRLRARLRTAVPAFTKAIAAGVAVAEEPLGGESFGMDRCRLVAGALVRAALRKRSKPEDRVFEIEEAFREQGLDPTRPYLNPRSRDDYRLLRP